MKDFKCTCACYAGFVGLGLCTIMMIFSMVGVAAVSLSRNSNTDVMDAMSSINTNTSISQNVILDFFEGVGGEIVFLASFCSMFLGMWYSGRRKLMPLTIVSAVILYISMYPYYSIGLQIVGTIIMAITHTSTYSYKVAKMLKLE
ncbi:MAG: hypothetical protein ACRD92_01640 [Nitrosopumilaceae archaeon]